MLTTRPRPLPEFLYLLYESDEQKTIIDGNHEAVSFAMPPQMVDLMPGFNGHTLAFTCNKLHKEYKEDYRHTTGNDPFVAFRITACGRLWVAPGTVFSRDGSLDILVKNSPFASYAEDFKKLHKRATRVRLHLDPDWALSAYSDKCQRECRGCGICGALRMLSDFSNLSELEIFTHSYLADKYTVMRKLVGGIATHLQGRDELKTVKIRFADIGPVVFTTALHKSWGFLAGWLREGRKIEALEHYKPRWP